MYGLLEKQFRNLFDKADRLTGITGENFLSLLERRLDNIIYRSGFTNSRAEARQLVRHGHFTVNGKRINIPSYQVKAGDVIAEIETDKATMEVEAVDEGVVAELLVAAPYLAVVFANWFLYYPAERALSRTSSQKSREAFWSLPGFVLFNARMFALMVMLPVLLVAGMNTVLRFFPEWLDDGDSQLVSILFMVMFILIIPYSLAAALILPNTAVLSREPWKRSAPWPMAPRKTSVPPWVSLPISPTLTTTSW